MPPSACDLAVVDRCTDASVGVAADDELRAARGSSNGEHKHHTVAISSNVGDRPRSLVQ